MTVEACQKCGKLIAVSDWSCCPHKGRGAASVIGDEIDETHRDLDPSGQPIRFRSRVEKQRYLDAHHLEPMVRWSGPQDQHVPRWATMDAQTLANAQALVARVAQQPSRAEPVVTCETAEFTVRTLGVGA